MFRNRRAILSIALSVGFAVAGVGCDRDGGTAGRQENDAVKHDPVVPPPTTASTRPAVSTAAELNESYLYLREIAAPRWSGDELILNDVQNLEEVGEKVAFPGARLKLTHRGNESLVALLFSNDPKDALKATWQGDRYYFRMPLRVRDPKALDASPYRLRVSRDQTEETTEGVFLAGDRYQLEPIDLSVTFSRRSDVPGMWSIWVGGVFKQRDTSDVTADPKWYIVKGELF
ncbi:MAG TPA: hypothetical protein VF796_19390, partial [Humisphaera sp.]